MNRDRMFMKNFFVILIFIFLFISCKDKPVFVDPAYVLMKWGDAVKNMNYREYSECEAFPKDARVFNELYRNYYYTDFLISEMSKFNDKKTRTDPEGKSYNYRIIHFECLRVERKTGKPVENMKGDIEFIRYLESPDADRGWLMSNRTIVRIEVDN